MVIGSMLPALGTLHRHLADLHVDFEGFVIVGPSGPEMTQGGPAIFEDEDRANEIAREWGEEYTVKPGVATLDGLKLKGVGVSEEDQMTRESVAAKLRTKLQGVSKEEATEVMSEALRNIMRSRNGETVSVSSEDVGVSKKEDGSIEFTMTLLVPSTEEGSD